MTTYTQLKQDIQDYIEDTDAVFVGKLDRFILQAEERINRSVIISDLRKNATSNFIAGDQYLQKPTDFLAQFSLSVTNGAGTTTYLQLKDQNFLQEAYPDSEQGVPKYYANFDDDFWEVRPIADAVYTVTLKYYFDPESITTASSGRTWLGDNAESLLLYGCLIEAYRFLKGEDDVLAQYRAAYDEALAHLERLGMLRQRRDDYREGELR